jgi:hypothetical protein
VPHDPPGPGGAEVSTDDRRCQDATHVYDLDVVGRLVIDVSPTCECGQVQIRLTDLATQQVTFTYVANG